MYFIFLLDRQVNWAPLVLQTFTSSSSKTDTSLSQTPRKDSKMELVPVALSGLTSSPSNRHLSDTDTSLRETGELGPFRTEGFHFIFLNTDTSLRQIDGTDSRRTSNSLHLFLRRSLSEGSR